MELWSLMHFLMPAVFSSHSDFKEWFSNPLTGMVEGSQDYNESIITRLHQVIDKNKIIYLNNNLYTNRYIVYVHVQCIQLQLQIHCIKTITHTVATCSYTIQLAVCLYTCRYFGHFF